MRRRGAKEEEEKGDGKTGGMGGDPARPPLASASSALSIEQRRACLTSLNGCGEVIVNEGEGVVVVMERGGGVATGSKGVSCFAFKKGEWVFFTSLFLYILFASLKLVCNTVY